MEVAFERLITLEKRMNEQNHQIEQLDQQVQMVAGNSSAKGGLKEQLRVLARLEDQMKKNVKWQEEYTDKTKELKEKLSYFEVLDAKNVSFHNKIVSLDDKFLDSNNDN